MDDLFALHVIARDEQRDLEQLARHRAEALIDETDRLELHACAVTTTSTNPAHAIVQYARVGAIDLIVVGTHGRGPIGHLIDGNVAERVVRTAPCPVLTVHNPERSSWFLTRSWPSRAAELTASGEPSSGRSGSAWRRPRSVTRMCR